MNSAGDLSSVWYYFLKSEDGKSAKCKNEDCKKILKTTKGNTTGLHKHLKSCHKIDLVTKKASSAAQRTDTDKGPRPKRQKVSDNFKALDETLARMASKDGLPFKLFCTSEDLRKMLIAYGFVDLPASPTRIRDRVVGYGNHIRQEQVDFIQKCKSSGQKFSLTFDEWSSQKNRKYLNLILHGGECQIWNMGIVRILGATSAGKCLAQVVEKLSAYNVCIEKDIVSIATDGTSMMTKIGRISPCHQQLCFAHGIQLAVIDVLYANKNNETTMDSDEVEMAHFANIEGRDDNSSAEETTSDPEDGLEMQQSQEFSEVSHIQLKPVINKVQAIVKLFRRSPLKNDTLQKHIKEDSNQELTLVLDSKTRWTSLLHMLERFQKLKNSVNKCLIDFDSEKLVTADEWNAIGELICALQPVKATVEALCRRDANLFTADIALKFLVEKLEAQETKISENLSKALVLRISQRRTEVSGLLKYLYSREIQKDKKFGNPKATKLCRTMISFIDRLLPQLPPTCGHIEGGEPHVEDPAGDDQIWLSPAPGISRKRKINKNPVEMELDNCIKEALLATETKTTPHGSTLAATIKKEMNLFQGGGSRGKHLQLAFNYLKTIPPTRVESERAFSSAGHICNKIRSRMSDGTLDSLCILRSHFQVKDNI